MRSIVCNPELEVEQAGVITVVRFTERSLRDGDEVQAAAEQLFDLIDPNGCRNLMLDFSGVMFAGTAMLARLFALHKQVKRAGGRLAFCNVGPFLNEVFDAVRLSDQVSIFG